jgi:hypothetical protein
MARFRSILGRATDDDEQPIGLEIPETTCKNEEGIGFEVKPQGAVSRS